MLTLARDNAAQAGLANARFLHGHIEDIPLPGGHVDVIISNCVINLSADKARVLAEAFRVLRPGGRLGISDVIADDGLDPRQRGQAEQRVGCTSGTLTPGEYHDLLIAAGFTGTSITATHDAGDGLLARCVTTGAAAPGAVVVVEGLAVGQDRVNHGPRAVPGRAKTPATPGFPAQRAGSRHGI
jgi:arsenite methyltransferase